jgi:Flp pilus assembly protein TadD
MNQIYRTRLALVTLLAAVLAGCAGAPTVPEAGYSAEELRNSDNDVLFATEFPVASKAEALLRADAARKAGEIDKALFFYVKALRFDPEDTDLLMAIGLLHQMQGNNVYAVRAYTLALRTDPDYVNALEARGLLLLANEENERATEDLRRAVELDPTAWQAQNGLGVLADRRGDRVTAIMYYDRALELKPDSGAVLNNRGYSKLLDGHYVSAEIDLIRAARDLGHEQAWVNLGTLYSRLRRYDLAVDALREALPAPEAFNKVAEASMENGDYTTATKLLEEAIRISPTYFPAAEANLAELRLIAEAN